MIGRRARPEPYYRHDLALVHHLGYGFHADACAPGILALLEPVRAREGLVLELGCGSGPLTRHLVEGATGSSRRAPPRRCSSSPGGRARRRGDPAGDPPRRPAAPLRRRRLGRPRPQLPAGRGRRRAGARRLRRGPTVGPRLRDRPLRPALRRGAAGRAGPPPGRGGMGDRHAFDLPRPNRLVREITTFCARTTAPGAEATSVTRTSYSTRRGSLSSWPRTASISGWPIPSATSRAPKASSPSSAVGPPRKGRGPWQRASSAERSRGAAARPRCPSRGRRRRSRLRRRRCHRPRHAGRSLEARSRGRSRGAGRGSGARRARRSSP
jgi:hypothetical protein